MTLIVQARFLTHQHPQIIFFCLVGFDPSWMTELSSFPTTQMLCKGVMIFDRPSSSPLTHQYPLLALSFDEFDLPWLTDLSLFTTTQTLDSVRDFWLG